MRVIPIIASMAVFWPTIAAACDDHVGKCKIEEVATCNTGQIRLRLYDGKGEARKFIGVESAYIRGHTFKAIKLQAAKPRALSIKYSIEQE